MFQVSIRGKLLGRPSLGFLVVVGLLEITRNIHWLTGSWKMEGNHWKSLTYSGNGVPRGRIENNSMKTTITRSTSEKKRLLHILCILFIIVIMLFFLLPGHGWANTQHLGCCDAMTKHTLIKHYCEQTF